MDLGSLGELSTHVPVLPMEPQGSGGISSSQKGWEDPVEWGWVARRRRTAVAGENERVFEIEICGPVGHPNM